MNITTKTFLDFVESATEATNTCLMIIRTCGPDCCSDHAKCNEIYSTYKTNMDGEDTGVFPTFLANEWTFLEFEDEDEAMEYARDNLPMNKKETDPDYFVQWWLFNSGAYVYGNDNLTKLSHRVAG